MKREGALRKFLESIISSKQKGDESLVLTALAFMEIHNIFALERDARYLSRKITGHSTTSPCELIIVGNDVTHSVIVHLSRFSVYIPWSNAIVV